MPQVLTTPRVLQLIDRAAYRSIQTVRWTFDLLTWYGHDNMNKDKWLNRVVFLETVAGVPGMVGGMIRHLHSLRLMRHDKGWIYTLLDEVRLLNVKLEHLVPYLGRHCCHVQLINGSVCLENVVCCTLTPRSASFVRRCQSSFLHDDDVHK
jgi:hypothetical protein